MLLITLVTSFASPPDLPSALNPEPGISHSAFTSLPELPLRTAHGLWFVGLGFRL